MPDRTGPSPSDLGRLALDAARAGAAAIRSVTAAGNLQVGRKTAGHDLVTAADRAAEEAVLRVVLTARPHDAVLAEESGRRDGTSGVRWIVDPLDGTANYVYGRADYAVSVAAEVDGVLRAGAIVRPADGAAVMAGGSLRRGFRGSAELAPAVEAGATPVVQPPDDGYPLALTEPGSTADALVAFGMPYALPDRRLALRLLSDLVPRLRGVRVIGSAACDFLSLASGQVDAACAIGLAEWDTAAGQALVAAAGGSCEAVRTASGLDVLVAGSASTVRDLVARIAAAAG